MSLAAKVLAQVESLPVFPCTAARVNELLQDENSSMVEFATAIEVDPALSVQLLKLANSAYFGRRAKVVSVRQAVSLVGVTRLRELVLAASFASVMPDRLPGYGIDAHEFWGHSIAVALLAESIAGYGTRVAASHAFTAGLLHDIGKLAIAGSLAQCLNEVLERLQGSHDSLAEAEAQVMGVNHMEAGAWCAECWGLPSEIGDVARFHHIPNQAPEATRPLVDVVHAADALSVLLGYGTGIGELSCRIVPQAMVRLDIDVHHLEAISSDTHERICELCALV